MTKKEQTIVNAWMAEINVYEQQQRDLWRELGELYVARGGGEKPTCSLLAHYDYLQTSADRKTRDKAKIIWTLYHEAGAQIEARTKLGQALADIQ